MSRDLSCDQVNNAGCMVNQRELTDDGLEKNFATNTLGTVLCECTYPARNALECTYNVSNDRITARHKNEGVH